MFPCGSTLFINFPNKNVQNNTEIGVSLCEFFRIYPVIYRHICELFQKREFMDSVEPRGNTSLATEIVGYCLPVSLTSHSNQESSE